MTLRTPAKPLAVAMLLLAFASASAWAAGEVNLSRYVLSITNPDTTTASAAVDIVRVQEFCADEDGCTLSLRLEAISRFAGSDWHLYYSTLQTKWRTATSSGRDANTTVELVAEVADGATVECSLTDADGDNSDSGSGFQLDLASAFAETVCVLVIID